MQTVKAFVQGTKPYDTNGPVMTSIEEQINLYLKENPNHSAKSMSIIVGQSYREAFVIFDVREPKDDRSQKNNYRQNQK